MKALVTPPSRLPSKARAWALLSVALLVLGGAVSQPAAVAAIAAPPADPGHVRMLANCFDACSVTVLLEGNGSGTFYTTNSSHVANGLINCVWLNGAQAPGSDCTETYCCVDRASPVTIYFTFSPAAGSKACYGAIGCINGNLSSTRTLPSQNTPVSIAIEGSFYLNTYTADVAYGGTGVGSASSSPSGILCPPSCSYSFNYGTQLTLTASPNGDSYFDHWTGACAGQGATCHLTVTGAISTMYFLTIGSPPTATPAAPTLTPIVTPRVTAKPTGTPTPGKTQVPNQGATSVPVPTDAAATSEPASADPGATLPGTTPEATGAPTPQATSAPPVVPAVAGTDLTPIALAILGAGLLIAIGIGVAAFALRRRPAPPA